MCTVQKGVHVQSLQRRFPRPCASHGAALGPQLDSAAGVQGGRWRRSVSVPETLFSVFGIGEDEIANRLSLISRRVNQPVPTRDPAPALVWPRLYVGNK